MKTEYRTSVEAEANQLDMDMYRMVGRIHQFGEHVRSTSILAAAASLESSRSLVRMRMHIKDQEATNG